MSILNVSIKSSISFLPKQNIFLKFKDGRKDGRVYLVKLTGRRVCALNSDVR